MCDYGTHVLLNVLLVHVQCLYTCIVYWHCVHVLHDVYMHVHDVCTFMLYCYVIVNMFMSCCVVSTCIVWYMYMYYLHVHVLFTCT